MNRIDWKVLSDEYGEAWESYLFGYRFRIAFPCWKHTENPFTCLLCIDRKDQKNNTFIKLEEQCFDSFLEANDVAEKVYAILEKNRPHCLS